MKVKNMRLLDRWVGVPMSFGMTGIRWFFDLFRSDPPAEPRRILFVKLVEQGATVIAEPTLRRAVEMVGRENVFVAVFSENRFILDVLDVIPAENVICIRSTGLTVCAIDSLRAIRRMHREKIDAAIDLEFFSRFSAALTFMSGASRRVGFHSFAGEAAYRGDLMTHRCVYNVTLHASETYRMLVEALTQRPEQMPMLDFKPHAEESVSRFQPTKEEVREVESLLADVTGREQTPPLILLNANSGDLLPLRRWSSQRYVELAQALLDQYPDAYVAFTGAPDEQAEAESLAAEVDSPRCISLGGRTTLRQLLVVYELAEVLVTNDSGPAHYASMTSIDVVTLFGPETPAVFGSRSSRSHFVWVGLACSPCVNAFNQRVTTCQNNLCMQSISVAQVLQTTSGAYDKRRSGREGTRASSDPKRWPDVSATA